VALITEQQIPPSKKVYFIQKQWKAPVLPDRELFRPSTSTVLFPYQCILHNLCQQTKRKTCGHKKGTDNRVSDLFTELGLKNIYSSLDHCKYKWLGLLHWMPFAL
jgi:hypothetical protein